MTRPREPGEPRPIVPERRHAVRFEADDERPVRDVVATLDARADAMGRILDYQHKQWRQS